MIDHEIIGEWLRWGNVGLSALVVALLITGAVHRWHIMPKQFQRIAPWVIGTYVIIAYSSGEAAQAGVSPGLRVFLLSLDLVGLIIACLFGLGDDDYQS